MSNKTKSKKKTFVNILLYVIAGLLYAFVIYELVCKFTGNNVYLFGYRFDVVLTDSMEPVYKVDTAIITYKEEPSEILKKWNEISTLNLEMTDERNINLTFVDAYNVEVETGIPEYCDQTRPTKAIMTHQLFKIIVDESIEEGKGRYTFLVHGINISEHQSQQGQYQAFTEKELLGVVKLNSSFVGAISSFFTSVWGLFICLLIPCLYLVITSVLDIFKAYNSEDEEEATAAVGSGANSGASIDNLSQEEYEKLKAEMINEMLNGKGDKKK